MRSITDISKNAWSLWLDKAAEWQNDPLFAPSQVDLNTLPVNPPTGGWDALATQDSKAITLPASVEEYYSGGQNGWEYRGISWFTTQLEIPQKLQGKRLSLHIEKTRLRAEIYVNQNLAGYDLVSETPYDIDISDFVKCGETNDIAIRICNPGGTRGWNDILSFRWGKNEMMPGHDFALAGHVHLIATDETYIEDIFVKNILPALKNNLEIITRVMAKTAGDANFTLEIIEASSQKAIYTENFKEKLVAGENTLSHKVSVPMAKCWDLETPNLYQCKLILQGDRFTDEVQQRFGFRVIEVRENHLGVAHFYLNDKRFRHKSAIDWGFYAHVGGYATEEMAEKSVQAAKDIGHNGINFHRQIGEPLVLDKADEMGLYLYEEPGGIKSGDLSWMARLVRVLLDPSARHEKVFEIERHSLAMKLAKEKVRRMVVRDRNHPSLLFYTMSNEERKFTAFRRELMELIISLDETRFISNSSGTTNTASTFPGMKAMGNLGSSTYTLKDQWVVKIHNQYSYRPYASNITRNHVDGHTVAAEAKFQEEILSSHPITEDSPTRYWGEVACYTGPSNWYDIHKAQATLPHQQLGYDDNIYQKMYQKIDDNFEPWNLQGSCAGAIKTKSDVSRQAGRGLMYTNGRFCQTMSSHNGLDGFAINGWSSGPQVGSELTNPVRRMGMDWDSAIVDEGRNLKGPAEDYAYWTKPLQIAVFRESGKYFKPGDSAKFRVALINEGKLSAGQYSLKFSVTDGKNQPCDFVKEITVNVEGGSIFSQELETIELTFNEQWHGGHITLVGELFSNDGNLVADGAEQVLLNNPISFKASLKNKKGAVYKWSEAEEALKAADTQYALYQSDESYDFIAAGDAPSEIELQQMLAQVKNGTKLIIHFSPTWAEILLKLEVLSEPVTEWTCKQEGFWYGNGWGYISQFAGEQAIPSRSVIGTNSWEPRGNPEGFYPFKSKYACHVHGLWMARHDVMRVLMASIDYGKGQLILNPSYKLDTDNLLSSMIFYNILSV